MTVAVARVKSAEPSCNSDLVWTQRPATYLRGLRSASGGGRRSVAGCGLAARPGSKALARLIQRRAGIRWRAWYNALIWFTELGVETKQSTRTREPHPPCTKIPC